MRPGRLVGRGHVCGPRWARHCRAPTRRALAAIIFHIGGTSMRKPGTHPGRHRAGACGLWHAFCTANNCQARRKRMPSLTPDPGSSPRSAAGRTPRALSSEHSFPSRLRLKPTVHKSVPKPTAPPSFKTTRGFPSQSQAFQPVRAGVPRSNQCPPTSKRPSPNSSAPSLPSGSVPADSSTLPSRSPGARAGGPLSSRALEVGRRGLPRPTPQSPRPAARLSRRLGLFRTRRMRPPAGLGRVGRAAHLLAQRLSCHRAGGVHPPGRAP